MATDLIVQTPPFTSSQVSGEFNTNQSNGFVKLAILITICHNTAAYL
ncbi:MAG: hypothetical protein WBX38_16390 [Candidatus Sulfotelmatobacter sp.]